MSNRAFTLLLAIAAALVCAIWAFRRLGHWTLD